MVKPSSVEKITLGCVIQKQHIERALKKILPDVFWKRNAGLMRMPETCKLLGWQCGHFQIVDLLSYILFQSSDHFLSAPKPRLNLYFGELERLR